MVRGLLPRTHSESIVIFGAAFEPYCRSGGRSSWCWICQRCHAYYCSWTDEKGIFQTLRRALPGGRDDDVCGWILGMKTRGTDSYRKRGFLSHYPFRAREIALATSTQRRLSIHPSHPPHRSTARPPTSITQTDLPLLSTAATARTQPPSRLYRLRLVVLAMSRPLYAAMSLLQGRVLCCRQRGVF